MARKSIKINLNENNGHDKENNKFLDQQESITGTIKLLLLLAIKHTGYKDLRNAIIEEVLEDRKLFDKREMDNKNTTNQSQFKHENGKETRENNSIENENKDFNFFDNDNLSNL